MSDTTRCQGHCSGCYGTRTASHVLDVVLSLPSDARNIEANNKIKTILHQKEKAIVGNEWFDWFSLRTNQLLMIFFKPEIQLRLDFYSISYKRIRNCLPFYREVFDVLQDGVALL